MTDDSPNNIQPVKKPEKILKPAPVENSWSSWASSVWTDVSNTASDFTKAFAEENKETIDSIKDHAAVKQISTTINQITENESVGELLSGVKEMTNDIVQTSSELLKKSVETGSSLLQPMEALSIDADKTETYVAETTSSPEAPSVNAEIVPDTDSQPPIEE